MNRKTFIKTGLVATSVLGAIPTIGKHLQQEVDDSIDVKTIKAFVTAGHNDLNKVKAMLEEKPNLIYSRYDWGSGDFEEAIDLDGAGGGDVPLLAVSERGA